MHRLNEISLHPYLLPDAFQGFQRFPSLSTEQFSGIWETQNSDHMADDSQGSLITARPLKHPWGCKAQTPQLATFLQSVGAYRGRICPKSIPSRVVSNAELAINTFVLKGINKWMNVWSVECGNVDISFKMRPAVIHLENIGQWPIWRQRIWICDFFAIFFDIWLFC